MGLSSPGVAPLESQLAFAISFQEDTRAGAAPVTVRYIASSPFERRQILAKLAYTLRLNNDAHKLRKVTVDPGLRAEAALQAAIQGADASSMAPQYA